MRNFGEIWCSMRIPESYHGKCYAQPMRSLCLIFAGSMRNLRIHADRSNTQSVPTKYIFHVEFKAESKKNWMQNFMQNPWKTMQNSMRNLHGIFAEEVRSLRFKADSMQSPRRFHADSMANSMQNPCRIACGIHAEYHKQSYAESLR